MSKPVFSELFTFKSGRRNRKSYVILLLAGLSVVLAVSAWIFIPVYLDEGLLPETDVPPEEISAPPDDVFNSRIVPFSQADLQGVEQAATAAGEMPNAA